MNIPKSLLRRAVAALREVAQFEAGTSQGSGLITKTETQAWEDATHLDALLRLPDPPVAVEDEPQ